MFNGVEGKASTPDSSNHVFIKLALCTGAQSCLNSKKPSSDFCLKVGSAHLAKLTSISIQKTLQWSYVAQCGACLRLLGHGKPLSVCVLMLLLEAAWNWGMQQIICGFSTLRASAFTSPALWVCMLSYSCSSVLPLHNKSTGSLTRADLVEILMTWLVAKVAF